LSQLHVAGSQQLDNVEPSVTASLVDEIDERCRRLSTTACPTSAICDDNDDAVGVDEH
jgi:hypothetical protein